MTRFHSPTILYIYLTKYIAENIIAWFKINILKTQDLILIEFAIYNEYFKYFVYIILVNIILVYICILCDFISNKPIFIS